MYRPRSSVVSSFDQQACAFMWNCLSLVFVPIAVFLFARPLAAGELQPHRAIYQMALAKAGPATDVIAADGIMLYRFARSCDGWTIENKTILRLSYENDSSGQTVWTFASWESADGRHFRFHARYEDGEKVDKIAGRAELNGDNGGEALFSEPEERRVELPRGTLFPTAHMRELLGKASAGEKILNRVVFDGASLENPYIVNALLGPLADSAAEALAKAAGLAPMPAWWTRMAFFPLASTAPLPEFEIDAQYRADGIADRIRQSFERLGLDVRLQQLEVLPSPDC